MSELPEGWEMKTIGEICDKPQYGWTTSAVSSGEVKLLRTTDLSKGPVNWETVPYCAEVPAKLNQYLVQDGDIFISRAGSIGFSAHVNEAPPHAVFASYLIRIRSSGSVLPSYLSLFLQSPSYWEQVNEASAGIALANINAVKIKNLQIPVPSLQIQQRIIETVEDLLSRLDKVSQLVLEARERIQTFWGETLNQFFVKEPTENNSGLRLGDLLRFKGGYSYKSNEWKTSGVPVIKIANVQRENISWHKVDYVDFESAIKTKDYEIIRGDLVLTLTGELLGASAIYDRDEPARLNQRVVKISVRPDKVLSVDYLHSFLQSPLIREALKSKSKGAAQPNVSIKDLSELLIAVPSESAQEEILTKWREIRAQISSIQRVLEHVELQIQNTRKSLLHVAFNGQLKIEDANE